MRAVKVFIFLMMGFLGSAAVPTTEKAFLDGNWQDHPFWESSVQTKELESGKVLVSAFGESKRSFMKGVGLVKVSLEKAYRFAQDYSRLEQLPKYFSQVRFDPKTRILEMQASLPFRKVEKMRIQIEPHGEGDRRALFFEVLQGFSSGTKGVLLFEDLKRQAPTCRISLQAVTAQGQEFSWITHVGIEALLRHVAISMRSLLEKENP